MRRRLLIVFAVLFTLTIIGSCYLDNMKSPYTDQQKLEALRSKIDMTSSQVAIAFIGYVDYDATEEEIEKIIEDSLVCQEYPFLKDAEILKTSGIELYAIVPTADSYISLHTLNEETVDENAFITLNEGKPLILQCNKESEKSDIAISVNNSANDILITIRPVTFDGKYISQDGCYDFSVDKHKYIDNSKIYSYGFLEKATKSIHENKNTNKYIDMGFKLICYGGTEIIDDQKCLLFELGVDDGKSFTRKQSLAVNSDLAIYVFDSEQQAWQSVEI